jgi:invasion protein IalB
MMIMRKFAALARALRSVAFVRTGLVATALSIALPASTIAQQTAPAPAPAQAAPAQPWQVNCASAGANEKLVCQMTQTLVAKANGQRVLASVIVKKPDGSGYFMTLGLPHGLYLPAGVSIWIDEGAKSQHPIETADQNGSYARIDLAKAVTDAMRRGQLLNVAVASAARDEVILQLSLAGFAASMDKI